jgi:hypothetical protein
MSGTAGNEEEEDSSLIFSRAKLLFPAGCLA